MQLYYVEFEDGCGTYVKENEYDDLARAMALLSVKYTAIVVEDKMYAIHWFDYIDDEWAIIWSTEDQFAGYMKDIIEAQVEYHVEVFN